MTTGREFEYHSWFTPSALLCLHHDTDITEVICGMMAYYHWYNERETDSWKYYCLLSHPGVLQSQRSVTVIRIFGLCGFCISLPIQFHMKFTSCAVRSLQPLAWWNVKLTSSSGPFIWSSVTIILQLTELKLNFTKPITNNRWELSQVMFAFHVEVWCIFSNRTWFTF
mgnify:CR=1 FL=1